MDFRSIIDSPCGLRHIYEALELQSGAARRFLLSRGMMASREEIEGEYAKLREFHSAFTGEHIRLIGTLTTKLCRLRDVFGTVKRLGGGETMDDIELFEIKNLCLLAEEVAPLLREAEVTRVRMPDVTGPLDVLDPERQRVASFHVYDSYSVELSDIRKEIRKSVDVDEELQLRSLAVEAEVRRALSRTLREDARILAWALEALAETDILIAKATQMDSMGLTFPEVSDEGNTEYQGLFHPMVKEILSRSGKEFQPVDITFGRGVPTTIIGANMGGKTVVLKMTALAQYLFQFGFGIPARSARIDIKENIRLYAGDDESMEKGLSSFAAEVKNINAVIVSAREGLHDLSLIDEPARTTNPVEGTALVASLIDIMQGAAADLIITTHYSLGDVPGQKLRVRGLENGVMNYELMPAGTSDVPHEAIAIAQSLDADQAWIEGAKCILERKEK